MAADQLESILAGVERLTSDDQIKLMQRLVELVATSATRGGPKPLMYGKYRDAPGHLSTEDDFKVAEWHPTEADLNGL